MSVMTSSITAPFDVPARFQELFTYLKTEAEVRTEDKSILSRSVNRS